MSDLSFKGQKVLVVGGAGFVGSNLVKMLLANDVERVLIIDNLLSADMINVPSDDRVSIIPYSVADERVLAQIPNDLDYVWHLACYHGNQSSIHDPIADHDNNTVTSLRLFERLKDIKSVKKVVYAAAGCAVAEKTFDEPSATPEDAPISLFHDSPYSLSKLFGEFYGNYYYTRHGLPFVKARFQNIYGPGEILGAGHWRGTVHTVWRNVTPTFIFRSLHQEALPLDNGGDASRDFIFVEDLVRGLMILALRGEPSEAYNLGSGVETSILRLAELINQETQNPTPPAIKPRRDWDTSGKRFGDPTKSREKLGFVAEVSIEEGVKRTVAWTKENLEYIKKTMAKHRKMVLEVEKYL